MKKEHRPLLTCERLLCKRTSSPACNICLLAWPSSTVLTRWAKFKLHTDSPRFFSTGAICTIIKVLLSPPAKDSRNQKLRKLSCPTFKDETKPCRFVSLFFLRTRFNNGHFRPLNFNILQLMRNWVVSMKQNVSHIDF